MSKPVASRVYRLTKIIFLALIATGLLFLGLSFALPQPALADGPNINLGDLPPGKVVTLTFRAAITDPIPAGVTQVCNQGTISGTNFATIATNDPTTPAANDPTCTPIDLEADLGISKTDGQTTAIPGQAITYTIVVTNAGPQPVVGATVSDTFPAALSGVTWDCVAGGGANCNGSSGAGNLNQSVDLPVGGRITYTVVATIAPAATGLLTNTASVSVPTGLSDPLPGNNSATDVDTLSPQIDLVVTKSESVDPVLAGSGAGNLTYVITVTNQGPSDAANVTMSEVLTLPAGVIVDAITPSAGSFISPTWTIPSLPVNASATLTVTLTVGASTAPGTDVVGDIASVTGADQTRINTGDDAASASTSVESQADLAISKSVTPASALPGQTITYTLVFTNNGPSLATGVIITDFVPLTVTNVASTSSGTSVTPIAGPDFRWQVEDLSPAEGGLITLTGQINPALTDGGVFTNTVQIGSATADGVTGNNSSSVGVTVPVADLALSKSVSPTNPGEGTVVTYTITLDNNSSLPASGVVVSDTLPSGLTFGGASATNGSYSPGTSLWTLASDVPAGGSATLSLTATVNAGTAGQTITNTAVISAAAEFDPVAGNNTASVALTVRSANLSIAKSGPATATPGTAITYTLTVSNSGPDGATGAVVADLFPVQINSPTWSCSPSGGATCAASGSGNLNETVNLPAGGRLIYTIVGTVNSAATGTVVNTATVTAPGGIDPNPGDNSSSVSTNLTPVANLAISKSSSRQPNIPTITYTLTISNAGPSAANGATVSDPLPVGVSGFTWSCVASGGATCNSGSGSGSLNQPIPTFPVGGQVVYTIIASLVSADATVTNTATVTVPGGVTDPLSSNNTASNISTPNRPLFLPLIFKDFVLAPDLVIDSLTASSSGVTLVIRNQGNAPVGNAFWVDVYFNPSVPPGINQPWQTIASHGLVWGVSGVGLSQLTPGGTLTLTSGGAFYFPQYSSPPPLPVGANVYGLVDSVNFSTTYGAVQESNEANNRFGPVLSTAAAGSPTAGQAAVPSLEGLPPR